VSRDRYGNLLVSGGTPFELNIVPGAPEVSFTQPRDLRTGYYDCSYDIADRQGGIEIENKLSTDIVFLLLLLLLASV